MAKDRFGLAVFPAVVSRTYLARALAERGLFDEADAQGREAVRLAEALDHPFSVGLGWFDLAYVKRIREELTEAVPLLERAVALCREWNITSQTPVVMAALGHAYALSGRSAEGVSCLQQALAIYESIGVGVYHSLNVEHLGEAYLRAGPGVPYYRKGVVQRDGHDVPGEAREGLRPNIDFRLQPRQLWRSSHEHSGNAPMRLRLSAFSAGHSASFNDVSRLSSSRPGRRRRWRQACQVPGPRRTAAPGPR
jgi:hypothetical protein